MKNWLIFFGLGLCLLPSRSYAEYGTDGQISITPVVETFGNTVRTRNIALSTSNAVLVSSAAENAVYDTDPTETIGIGAWRYREITNVSTCAAAAVNYTNSPPYNVYSTSYSVITSSDSTGLGAGDSYVPPHQDAVWMIWTPGSGNGSCAAGAGAVVTEVYNHPSKKR